MGNKLCCSIPSENPQEKSLKVKKMKRLESFQEIHEQISNDKVEINQNKISSVNASEKQKLQDISIKSENKRQLQSQLNENKMTCKTHQNFEDQELEFDQNMNKSQSLSLLQNLLMTDETNQDTDCLQNIDQNSNSNESQNFQTECGAKELLIEYQNELENENQYYIQLILPKVEWIQDAQNVLIIFHVDGFENLKSFFIEYNLILKCLSNYEENQIDFLFFESEQCKWHSKENKLAVFLQKQIERKWEGISISQGDNQLIVIQENCFENYDTNIFYEYFRYQEKKNMIESQPSLEQTEITQSLEPQILEMNIDQIQYNKQQEYKEWELNVSEIKTEKEETNQMFEDDQDPNEQHLQDQFNRDCQSIVENILYEPSENESQIQEIFYQFSKEKANFDESSNLNQDISKESNQIVQKVFSAQNEVKNKEVLDGFDLLLLETQSPIKKKGSNKKREIEAFDSIISTIKIHSPNSRTSLKQTRVSIKSQVSNQEKIEESKLEECMSEQNLDYTDFKNEQEIQNDQQLRQIDEKLEPSSFKVQKQNQKKKKYKIK